MQLADDHQIIDIGAETVTRVHSDAIPGHRSDEQYTWSLKDFEQVGAPHTYPTVDHSQPQNFRVIIYQNLRHDAAFSLVGLDASVANAFRRILLAEVPTVAGKTVFMHNNTSVIHDEVLAQRLGLVPLAGSPAGFDRIQWRTKGNPEAGVPGSDPDDSNTIIMTLSKTCTHNPKAAKNETDPRKLYHDAHVYARDLVWSPVGRQVEWFAGEASAVRPAEPDILLAKLRPGQGVDLEMHCVKGAGGDHAKFSPVATASYRLHPTIDILAPIVGADAEKFAGCFPKGVIGLEEVTRADARKDKAYEAHVGAKRAVVQDAFRDTVSRECLRHDEFKDKVKLGRIRDHFIFGVESTGQYPSDELFLKSVRLLQAKCTALKRDLDKLERQGGL